jgi:hypothetical protein
MEQDDMSERENAVEAATRLVAWNTVNPDKLPAVGVALADAYIVARAYLSSRQSILEEAAKKLDLVESELSGIRDDYIEAQHSGRHNGRRIRPEAARQYAHDFGERADATRQCAALLRSLSHGKAPDKEGEAG